MDDVFIEDAVVLILPDRPEIQTRRVLEPPDHLLHVGIAPESQNAKARNTEQGPSVRMTSGIEARVPPAQPPA